MLTLFWDKWGVILEHYIPRGNPVTSTTYAHLLKNHLHPAIKPKRCGHLSTGVLLQCEKAWSHTAHSTVVTNQDCPLSVFHIRRSCQTTPVTFMYLDHSNEAIECKSFRSDKEVQQALHERLHSQPKEFFSRGMRALPKRCNTCMECNGD
jgi:hypothetical protein